MWLTLILADSIGRFVDSDTFISLEGTYGTC